MKVMYVWILLLDILPRCSALGVLKGMHCCVLTSCMLYQSTRHTLLQNPFMSNKVIYCQTSYCRLSMNCKVGHPGVMCET
jgi:hypothetical protein